MSVAHLGKSMAKVRLDQLALSWRSCTDCALAHGRSRVVFYRGNPDAPICIVGAAPTRDDDARGEPLMGSVGKLLDELLDAAKVSSEEVFMMHMLGCRTPQDRAPRMPELRACAPRTLAMLTAVNPGAVLMLGITAAKLAGVTSVGPWRGMPVDVKLNARTLRGVVTYRPEFVLDAQAQGNRMTALSLRSMMVSDIKVARSLASARRVLGDERI